MPCPEGIHQVCLNHFFQVPFLVRGQDNLDSLHQRPRDHISEVAGPASSSPCPRRCIPRASQYRACGSEMAALHKSPIVQLLWKDGAKGERYMVPYFGN